MKKIIVIAIVFAMVIMAMIPTLASAATQDTVTITATPEFISISVSPSTWTVNGITGSGVILVDTLYYANPLGDTTAPSATVVDAECQFTITNTSSVATDIAVNMSNYTGSGDTMTNSDDGTNGATTFGAHSWASGSTYASKVVAKTTGSSVMKDALAATTNIKFGAEVETRTNVWTAGDAMTSTMTIIATAD